MIQVTVIVPSFPSEMCGISRHTKYLIDEMDEAIETNVIGERDAKSKMGLIMRVFTASMCSDVVHFQYAPDLYGYMGIWVYVLLLIAKIGKSKVVVTIHETPDPMPISLKDKLAYFYHKITIGFLNYTSNRVIVHSQSAVNLLAEWNIIEKVNLIPLGILNGLSAMRSNKDRDAGLDVGFFGFISQHKGIHRVVEALVDLPDVKFIVAGAPRSESDNQYQQFVRQLANKLSVSDRIEFLDFIAEADLPQFFESVNLVVFPYSSCTASGALSTALSHGCVTLASNIPVFQEIADKYDCLVTFDLNSKSDIGLKIRWLLTDLNRRRDLLNGIRRYMENANISQSAHHTLKLYESILF